MPSTLAEIGIYFWLLNISIEEKFVIKRKYKNQLINIRFPHIDSSKRSIKTSVR